MKIMTQHLWWACSLGLIALAGCGQSPEGAHGQTDDSEDTVVQKTDEQWKAELSEEQYRILRSKGTERPFDNKYWNDKRKGMYVCAGCGQELFSSETKFESGTGWPSFFKPADHANISTETDRSHGMVRTEVTCSQCGGHLGHVFEDAHDQPTGLRYCINSAALELKPAAPNEAEAGSGR